MRIANVEMAKAWDGEEGQRWAEQAEHYEQTGPGFWDALVRAMPIAPHDRILDIGCGTGRSTRDAARLAADGVAVGIDLSQQMLERARATARAEGLTNVTFEHGDAQVHPFPPASFDLAISSFGGMFFADPVAAFANVARALRHDGRLAMLAWRDFAANEWLQALRGVLAAGRDLPTPAASVPGPFGLADPAFVTTTLSQAGFAGVEVEAVDAPVSLGKDADDAFSFVSTMGLTRGLLHDLDPNAAAGATGELRRLIEEHATPEGVSFGGAAWLITARATG